MKLQILAMAQKLSTSLLLAVFTAGLAQSALAAHETNRLNKMGIRDFLQDMSDKSAGESDQAQTQQFLNRHLHDNARFKSTITYNMPGHPPQQTEMKLDKKQFLESVAAGAQTLQEYESEIDIKAIKISKDGRKATVETIGSESGYMSVPDESGAVQQVPIEGQSACLQIVMIDKNDIMQLYNARCETQINFERY